MSGSTTGRAFGQWPAFRRTGFSVLAGVLCAAVSGGAAGATTVAPDLYLHTICGQVAASAAQSDTIGVAVANAVQAFQKQPSQTNAVALRQTMVDGLTQTAQSIDKVTASARTAGTPQVPHGARFAKAVIAHVDNVARKVHALASRANAMDLTNPSQFVADIQAMSKKIDAAQKRANNAAARDPAFKNAAPALSPLVVFMTTDATTCAAPYAPA